MRIDKLSLLNFRCFRQLDITFDEHITILVAPNGAGKTTVLDAIRLALFPFIRGFDASLYVKDKSLAIRTEDVRLVFRPEALNMEMSSPAMITATGEWESGKTATWMLDKRGEQPPHEDKTAAQLTRWGEQLQTLVREEHNLQQVELPLMLYLGTARLWHQERYEAQPTEQRLDNSAFSRLSGYDDCLSATSNYKQFEQWYSWLWLSYREHQITQLESPSAKLKEGVRVQRMKEAIQAIQQAINCLTQEVTGWHDLEYSSSHNQQLVMNHPQHGKIPLSQLSDGLRNAVAMVADIAFRCVKLNPHLRDEAALKTQGIVLIDEVDMFLHPAWQQQIIQSLRSAFPLIQFIVTTHSPQVISTVKRESVRLLEQDEKGNGLASIPAGRPTASQVMMYCTA
ncbi:AAA family ATPase [Salmonella enterica subsp. enterica serovar Typhimurium]|nr:ATP-binding protein [Salmonella enterica]EDC8732402.1 AAA family ATPase [Salmonella enterica subsp. enterica serovar Typhimurium]EBI6503495.1 ATP-binding protein [Salmonella enterica]EDG2375870.1 AAA family ATPase [Salmonella enterica]EDI4538054.1 ATP-binding protein [Salmonella enterica subsp. enterica serovar Typhimurium]